MKKASYSSVLLLAGGFFLIIAGSCGQQPGAGDTEETSSTDTTDTTGPDDNVTVPGSLAIAGDLSTAFPDSLAISVFPESVDAEAAQAGTLAVGLTTMAEPPPPKTLRQKIDDQKAILAGTADSCLPAALEEQVAQTTESCYEFDQDMMFGSMTGGPANSPANGTHNGKNTAGEACLVAFARVEVAKVVSLVEETTGFVQAAICQAKKANAEVQLPAAGSELQLKDALVTIMGTSAQAVDSAVMTRLPDLNSRPVFRTEIKLRDRSGNNRVIVVAHSPNEEGTNDTYDGRLSLVMEGDVGGTQTTNPGSSNVQKKRLMSVQYARVFVPGTEEYRLRYELRTARMAEHIAEGAFVEGLLDLNANTNESGRYLKADGSAYSSEQENEAAESISYVSFDMNPDTNAGTLSYWQNPGGNYDENTRGMVFNLGHDADGNFKGCANSGSAGISFGTDGLSVRKSLKTGTALQPAGFWHPMMNTNPQPGCTLDPVATDADGKFNKKTCTHDNGDTQTTTWYEPKISDAAAAVEFSTKDMGALVTRQCYVQNAETGAYEIDPAEITEDAGYELIKTTNTAKFIQPPSFKLPPPPPPK